MNTHPTVIAIVSLAALTGCMGSAPSSPDPLSSSDFESLTMEEISEAMDDKEPVPVMEMKKEELIAMMEKSGKPTSNEPPTFSSAPIDFTHSYNKSIQAVAGASLIDTNGDGIEEIFVGGGKGQSDALFFFDNGAFVNRIDESGLASAVGTYGSTSLDMDSDGDTDLLVAREDGLYLHLNNAGVFRGGKLAITLPQNSIPIAVTASDINRDGWADLYVSTFIDAAHFTTGTFNKPAHATLNLLLLNNGDNTFTDITERSGLVVRQNTFLAVFVDLNNDGWQDLAVSPNTDTVKIFRNNGDQTFTEIPNLSKYGFWMGLAVGDIDQDGDQDLLFSNIGTSIPVSIARGDLRPDQTLVSEWLLLRNEGDFRFTDATAEKKLAGFEFGWGAIFEDFNLDSRLDLVVMESYIKWLPHKLNKLPGRFFLQMQDGTFTPMTDIAGVENRYYGMAPLASDFNRDGYPDLVFMNLAGPLRAFLNNGGTNAALSVILPDTAKSLGARVTVTTADGKKLHRQFVTGVGMLSDQSQALVFGMGGNPVASSVDVVWADGRTERRENVRGEVVFR